MLMPWDISPPYANELAGGYCSSEDFDMAESLQHKLDRVRSPRVHITYDVETGGAIEKKELPFVMGVFGDFTGQPEEPLPRLKDRKFVEINPDNFDSVLAAMKPHLAFQVENKISDDPDAGQVKVNLKFRSMEDFEPTQVAKQIKPLADLLDLRTKLSDLRGSLQGNDKLDDLLQAALRDSAQLDKLKGEIAASKGGETGGTNE
jgi:type VI secretion system protein ImpB